MAAVKNAVTRVRTQRKTIVRLPDAMLEQHRERFPDTFERNAVIAMFALRALARRVNDCTNDMLAGLGLNAAKYNYLVVIYMTPAQMLTLNEISALIHTSNATVTSMVAALQRDGLLRRAPHPTDGRSIVVRLTAKGRRCIEAAVPLHHRNIEAGMGELTLEERAQLAVLLLKLAAGFDRLP